MSMEYIGIDPGANGCIAFLSHDGFVVDVKLAGKTPLDVCNELVAASTATKGPLLAVIEKVASSPQMGVKSAFTFGKGYGVLLGALAASGIPHVEVTPQRWQKAMGCLTKGDKNVTKAKAQQLYPSVKVTHANADALLIATYCRQHASELF